MNERECLKYFSARGVYDRGPDKLVGAGPKAVRGLTWQAWFRLKWGESYTDYVARAKREGLGAQAVEFAERLGGKSEPALRRPCFPGTGEDLFGG